MAKTIAIDFDGVIHQYSKGWQNGEIYDEPVKGAFKTINDLMERGFSVIIFSTRSPSQIIEWIKNRSNGLLYYSYSEFQDRYYPMHEKDEEFFKAEYDKGKLIQYKVKKVPFWKKFWNDTKYIGVTRRKLPCEVYIDDRAIKFDGDWDVTYNQVKYFKTYQENNNDKIKKG